MKQSGVTLLELLVTLTILTILASVALPFTKISSKRTKEIELRQNLRIIRAAIDTFRLEWSRDGEKRQPQQTTFLLGGTRGPVEPQLDYPIGRMRSHRHCRLSGFGP